MADMSGSVWPPKTLTSQNVLAKDAILSTSASIRINAPAKQVFAAICNVGDYSHWNSFCPEVSIQSQPHGAPEDAVLRIGTAFTFHVVMDANKPRSYTPTQLKVTDISTPDEPSGYIPSDTLSNEDSYTTDLQAVYRISWKCEGGFVAKGLRTERFHEVIILDNESCEVRTWENQGGMLAHTVKWMYKKTLDEKFQLWCDDLKKYCENNG